MNEAVFVSVLELVEPLIASNDTATLTAIRDVLLGAVPLPAAAPAAPAAPLIVQPPGSALPPAPAPLAKNDPANPDNIFE